MYKRFGGEIRVPKGDVLRIERAAPVDTMTQTPRGSPPPVAPSRPSVPPTPAAPPVDFSPRWGREPTDTFAIVNYRHQLIETTPAGSRFSWQITIENLTDAPNAVEAWILFVDSKGATLRAPVS